MSGPRRISAAKSTRANGNTQGRVVGEPGGAAVPASQANPPVKPETAAEGITGAQVLDGLQTGLDVVGLIPGVGEVADLANAAISAARGDWIGAGLSLASAIPFAGWGATAAKAGRKVAKATAEAAGKGAKEATEKIVKEKTEKETKEAAEATVKKKTDEGAKVQGKRNLEKSKCGEWLAKMDMIEQEFDEVLAVQNNSGHGIDLIGRNSRTGAVMSWEVKTTDGASAPSLSEAQREMGGEKYTENRLGRAARGDGNYGKVPEAVANGKKAQKWIEAAKAKGKAVTYEKREVFVDDLDKGCAKHPGRPSRSMPWNLK